MGVLSDSRPVFVPKYISTGLWPSKAGWGSTVMCCTTQDAPELAVADQPVGVLVHVLDSAIEQCEFVLRA